MSTKFTALFEVVKKISFIFKLGHDAFNLLFWGFFFCLLLLVAWSVGWILVWFPFWFFFLIKTSVWRGEPLLHKININYYPVKD